MPKAVYKANNQPPFTYAILVIKPRNKPSIAALQIGPWQNFLQEQFSPNHPLPEHGDLHKHAAESLGKPLLSVAIISQLRRQPSSASKLQKIQIF